MENAAAIARECSIDNSYGDWRHLVSSPSIDAISIAVPPSEQPAIAMAAIDAGKHVFCEKPLAPIGSVAAQVFNLATTKHVVHGVDFIFPELPLWIRARDLICAGDLGQLRQANINWGIKTHVSPGDARSWKDDPDRGGGVLNNFVSHVVHNIEWLFGGIRSVISRLERARTGVESSVRGRLDMTAGFPVFISIGAEERFGRGHYLEVFGDEAKLVLANRTVDYASGFELSIETNYGGSLELVGRDEPQSNVDGRIAPVAQLASRFVDAILNGTPMRPNFADGMRAQLILDEMRASNQTGARPIKDSH